MEVSNIIAGSNVCMSREDNPFWDTDFVGLVEDYALLKYISSRRQVDGRVCELSKKQRAILRTEKRCVYAKSDPCWGFVVSQNKVVSACINGECPRIYECNATYTPEQSAFWKTSEEERSTYGAPELLREYYIVDMISDEEMRQYVADPENDGREFSARNPVIPDEKKEERKEVLTKIDKLTGRKMVVVGHRWVITDNASYENESLEPIWGFADEVEERRPISRKKAPKIEQISSEILLQSQKIHSSGFEGTEIKKIEKYVDTVKKSICSKKKLTSLESDDYELKNSVIVCVNDAEKAYVSSMLLRNAIEHGYDSSDDIKIVGIGEFIQADCDREVWLTGTSITGDYVDVLEEKWELLSTKSRVNELQVPSREYFEFSYLDRTRWCCRNMYGVTHVCFGTEDMEFFDKLPNGLYHISLLEDTDSYLIQQNDGGCLGRTSKDFVEVIYELIKAGEIASKPNAINGMSIKVCNDKEYVLGMGHMEFVEY